MTWWAWVLIVIAVIIIVATLAVMFSSPMRRYRRISRM